ncbi:MAG: TonB-dependent receptor plug domain-containing protein, partial [Gemmatimonadetes bacterium]|nr:Plug domain-containing protein [Gemmatimonadota bacterium]NIR37103.1 Plug domain-containing protein [Actinomycetota bacterium]NIU74984.1 TonB-dependent receptor plug domain-containing protein [Gammaproteobacteria bacterium]NIT85581.1 Plug domain-containing protein [Gemmatimonadota bacterium]NIX39257.1 TonB-dependent receptor plug domain-containing protein [Gemmatimonadota bacterium]
RRYHRNVGGHFITPHDIERSPARTTEDLLLGIPGVAVQPISDDGPGSEFGRTPFVGDRVRIRSGNGLCDPTVYVDGVRVPYRPEGRSPATLTSVVPLGSVEAVEVYRRPSEVPMEYNATQTGGSVCGVLVFWTRGGER